MAANEALMGALHDALARDLMQKIQDGVATAAEMSVARGLLKDSNITCAPAADNALGELEAQLAAKKARREARTTGSATPINFEQAVDNMDFLTGMH